LAIAGLRTQARAQRPGLCALMRTARVDPGFLDERAVAFRLAPRINAAGRLGHPRTALDLLLTEDADEAGRLAGRLEELNRERYGGHRAAAGLAVRPERIDALAEAFAAHADSVLTDGDLRPVITVDAVLPPGIPLTLDLCAELARLAPFGRGNPSVTLLAESC